MRATTRAQAGGLTGLLVKSACLAELAVLLHLDAIWIVFLVFVGTVVTILALLASESDTDSHGVHLLEFH
jgi:hypothetical protein